MGVVSAARARGHVTLMYGSSSVPVPEGVKPLSRLVYERSSAWNRLATWLGFSLQLAWHLLRHGSRYERLLVVSNPPFAPLLAPLARRPYSLLLYDLYPQVLQQLSCERRPPAPLRLLIHSWHWLNRQVYRRAERIYTLSAGMAQALQPCFVSPAEWQARVQVIPPWADADQLFPHPPASNPFRDQHHLEGKLLLIYSGNLGLTHPLEPLLDASQRLQSLLPLFRLLMIGEGPKRQRLEHQANGLQLANVCFLDPLPLDALPASLSAADLAVVALDGPAAAASLPSKTFSALACGTPLLVIAPHHSALAQLVHQHRCGLVVQPGPAAAQEIATLLTSLATQPGRLAKLAANALAASRYYTSANAGRLVDAWLGVPVTTP
jgi:colanic acid biosynthesis glycosyl transferase WcaI